MRRIFIIGGGIFLLAAAGVAVFYFAPSISIDLSQQIAKTGVVAVPDFKRDAPAGEKEYHSMQYHFSILYPDYLSVKEVPEVGGSLTVTFESIPESKGFQIYVLPYGQPKVTEQQFKLDNPSGVRKGLKNISIAGATGATFYGSDELLGDTAEVWFIKSPYLYEITTLKDLASWLEPIIQTWEFI
jgi:hypothetical protein